MDKTKIAVSLFNAKAGLYQEKYMDVSLYHDSLDRFCTLVEKKDAAVLELACGPGNITRYLLEQRPDLKILGTDLAPQMLELARRNNPAAEFRIMDCRDVGAISTKYDAVLCGFGLPYLSKEEAIELIGTVSEVLNPGGILYLSTMEDDYANSRLQGPSSGGPEQVFIHYHQADYLIDAIQQKGMELCHISRIDNIAANGPEVKDLVLIASTANSQ